NAYDPGLGRDGNDPGDDWHLDPGQVAALGEVVEVAIVEEQLRANVIGAGGHLSFQVVHFQKPVRRSRVSLWEARHADPESARVRNVFPALDERHQVARIPKGILRPVVVRPALRQVAAESQDVLPPGVRVPVQYSRQFFAGVTDTRQV